MKMDTSNFKHAVIQRRGEAENRGLIPASVAAQAVYRFDKTSVKTSPRLCLPVMAQGQGGKTGHFNSAKVCLNRSKC